MTIREFRNRQTFVDFIDSINDWAGEVVEVELRDTTIVFITSFYRKVDHLGEKEASGKVYTGKADGGDASKGVAHRVVMSLSSIIGEWWVVGASTTSNPRTDWCGVVPRARTEAHRSCGRFANGN